MTKKYTLELTYEEAANLVYKNSGNDGICKFDKLDNLRKELEKDRCTTNLRLPWGIYEAYANEPKWVLDFNVNWRPGEPAGPPIGQMTLEQARLASAAPELYEFLKAMAKYWNGEYDGSNDSGEKLRRLMLKAALKVETGIPE